MITDTDWTKLGTLPGRLGRTMLLEDIRSGIPEPEELEPDVLLKGRIHHVFSGPANGKSWVALRLAVNAMERGERVLYLDLENGKRIIAERLQELGVGDDLDELFYYVAFPALDLSDDARREYEGLLDALQPDLIVFDSWVNFLVASGLDESGNTDVERWGNAYLTPARTRGCTTIILDHVGHGNTNRARAASRKKDLVDVQWKLTKRGGFDRSKVGRIDLTLEKEREGWLTEDVSWSIGGTPEGFVCERSENIPATRVQGLTSGEATQLEALEGFGGNGATRAEWKRQAGGESVSGRTFNKRRDGLIEKDRVIEDDGRYYAVS